MKSVIILALIFAAFQAVTSASVNFEVKVCDAGNYYYYTSKTENGCRNCPAGTWANGTVPLTKCEPCAPGFYAPDKGYKWCSPCGAGTYEEDRTTCSKCPYGYTSAVGSSSKDDCGVCVRGAYSKSGDSRYCKDCPAGTFEVNRNSCLSCPPGMVSDEGSSECFTCPAGWIAVNNGTQCLPCPVGSRDVNRTSCELCPEGTFGDSGKCTTCPAGSIAPLAGSLTCTRCQPGTFEYKKTACFVCAAGTYGIDGISCRQCPALTISGVGSSNCTQCSTGAVAVKGNTRCQDEDGNEAGVQMPTTVISGSGGNNNNTHNSSSQNHTFFYVLGLGIIGALVFVGVSIRNRKLEYELQRDRLISHPAL